MSFNSSSSVLSATVWELWISRWTFHSIYLIDLTAWWAVIQATTDNNSCVERGGRGEKRHKNKLARRQYQFFGGSSTATIIWSLLQKRRHFFLLFFFPHSSFLQCLSQFQYVYWARLSLRAGFSVLFLAAKKYLLINSWTATSEALVLVFLFLSPLCGSLQTRRKATTFLLLSFFTVYNDASQFGQSPKRSQEGEREGIKKLPKISIQNEMAAIWYAKKKSVHIQQIGMRWGLLNLHFFCVQSKPARKVFHATLNCCSNLRYALQSQSTTTEMSRRRPIRKDFDDRWGDDGTARC